MLTKRIIVCLDVRDRMVTKGVKFKGNVDVGEPVALGARYSDEGADELVFYDIMASAQGRGIDIEMVRDIAHKVFIPFSVGGGIRNLQDMREVLLAGAEKVSLNSLAVQNPEIIRHGAEAFGRQCIVLGLDAKKVGVSEAFPSGYQVYINGGRKAMGLDAMEWALKAETLGVGEICLNSIDGDGTQDGYELNITGMMSESLGIPVIASGGAGTTQHIVDLFEKTKADAALVASMVHFNYYTLKEIKDACDSATAPMRKVV
jgi:cyclase